MVGQKGEILDKSDISWFLFVLEINFMQIMHR